MRRAFVGTKIIAIRLNQVATYRVTTWWILATTGIVRAKKNRTEFRNTWVKLGSLDALLMLVVAVI